MSKVPTASSTGAPPSLFSTTEGYFDAAVTTVTGGYDMVVSRHRTTPPTPDDLQQGLWWLTSTIPSGDRAAWTAEPVPILDAHHGQPWHASGAHRPSIRYGDTSVDRDTLYVFFNGIHHPPEPPFPAPFFCAIGRIRLPRPQLPRRLAVATGEQGLDAFDGILNTPTSTVSDGIHI